MLLIVLILNTFEANNLVFIKKTDKMDNNNTETKWYFEAIAAGIVFYFNNIFVFLICGESITLKFLLYSIPVAIVGGLIYRPTVDFVERILPERFRAKPKK